MLDDQYSKLPSQWPSSLAFFQSNIYTSIWTLQVLLLKWYLNWIIKRNIPDSRDEKCEHCTSQSDVRRFLSPVFLSHVFCSSCTLKRNRVAGSKLGKCSHIFIKEVLVLYTFLCQLCTDYKIILYFRTTHFVNSLGSRIHILYKIIGEDNDMLDTSVFLCHTEIKCAYTW